MAKSHEVLAMLIPDGGYVQYGDTFEGIEFVECEPITKKQYEEGFAKFDAWKANEVAAQAAAKQSILDRLGITSDEAALLLK